VAFVDEKSTYASWAAVKVLITAPSCEIDVPVVQLKWHVSCRVSEIPANDYALLLRVGCDCGDVEELTSVKLDSR
jgi:hypothetical protein